MKALCGCLKFAALIAAALIMAVAIRTYIVQPYVIPSESMEETIDVGDLVLSEFATFLLGDAPNPGDIVTFHSPEELTSSLNTGSAATQAVPVVLVKRVVATGGQTVTLSDGFVYVDGKRLSEAYTGGRPSYDLESPCVSYPYTVPKDHVWVMGDNRTASMDSRYFGAVPVEDITGKVVLRCLPVERFGAVD